MKQRIDIERLLHWAYRDELVKRVTSSAEEIWTRVADIGRWGGVDVQHHHGGPQRYDHGTPHPDAVAIEQAASALPDAVIDWDDEAELILGDLASLINPTASEQAIRDERTSVVGWPSKSGRRMRVVLQPPRRVLMVRTLRTSALVIMHAKMGTRPDWHEEPPYPLPMPATHGPNAKVIGDCYGKGRYAAGSYCPVRWWPSPMSIAQARADYLAWWRGLVQLRAVLYDTLRDHKPLSPSAYEMPWLVQERAYRSLPAWRNGRRAGG